MSSPVFPYRIFPLGDTAITVDFGNIIDGQINREVIARFNELQNDPLPGMTEAVPAYSSFTVYYDIPAVKQKTGNNTVVFEWMKQQIKARLLQPARHREMNEKLVKIPVCYDNEFAPDIQWVAGAKNISKEELVQVHTSKMYKVYMLGFLPGFAYMGEVDEKIAVPRKPQPVNIAAGSVGIAGKQTGVYPLASPGGWQIIGRTPVKLFKAHPNPGSPGQALPAGEALKDSGNSKSYHDNPTLLRAGDSVEFYPVNKKEFDEIFATETFYC
ncbi:MAG: 5-oxoprolinase subunit PxpB [Bacteroidota bacterium]